MISHVRFGATAPWSNDPGPVIDSDYTGRVDPWFPNQPIQEPSEVGTEESSNMDLESSELDDVAEGLETGEEVAGGAMPELFPAVVAHQLSTAIGSSINDASFASQQTANMQQYQSNIIAGGALGQQTAKNVYDWNTQQNQNTKAAGEIGNQFGLVGLAMGRLVGLATASSIPQDLKDTAWSPEGRIDPTSDGTSENFDSSGISSGEIQDGVQVSETSSAIDTTPQ